MADETFQHSALTSVPAADVWKALDSPQTWEQIPGVDRVLDPIVDDSGRLRGFDFESMVGGRLYRGQARPAAREEQRLIGWDITSKEIQGQVIVALTEQPDATRVDVRLDVSGNGFLGSLFFPLIASAIGSGFEETVQHFVDGL